MDATTNNTMGTHQMPTTTPVMIMEITIVTHKDPRVFFFALSVISPFS